MVWLAFALPVLTQSIIAWQVRITRQAGQVKSTIAMWRPDKFQEMNKRLMGIGEDGTAQPISKAKCLEMVRLWSRNYPSLTKLIHSDYSIG